jgi:5-carboxymethyl-2-hydroxymuconate isomerase
MPAASEDFDFDAAMFKLLGTVEEVTLEKLKANRALVFEIGDYCRKRKFYCENEAEGKEFTKGLTADQVYRHMVFKIASGGSRLVADGVAILLMPIVADKLAESCKVGEVR